MTLLAEASTSRALRLEQRIRYDYAAPVERLRQRLVVVPPPRHGAQRRLDWSITVDGADATVRHLGADSFGNVIVDIEARRVEGWIEFDATASVERSGPGDVHTTAVDPRYLRSTRLTRPSAPIRDLVERGAGPAELCAAVHRSLTYEWGITGVRTTAAEALRGGRGVCQDFAHVMIAACRWAGIAARYVSGHLVGEGGSHAWVEALLPGTEAGRWVVEAWDPTHGRVAGDGYVTVAVGRDYADVAPVSGSYVADRATGQLTICKRLTDLAHP